MARMVLEIDVQSNSAGVITKMTGEINSISAAAKNAAGGTLQLSGAMKSLISTFTLLRGIRFLTDAIKEGIQFNALIQQSRLSLSGLILTYSQIYDGQRKVTDATEQWNLANMFSAKVLEGLQVAAIKTTLQYSDLLRVTQDSMAYLLRSGITDPAKIVSFVTQFSQAAKAFGLNVQEIGTNIRGLFTGIADPRRARFAYTLLSELGGTAAERKKAIADLRETGQLFDYFAGPSGKFQAFKRAGDELSQSFTGALSNLKDALQQALGSGTSEATQRLTSIILELQASIVSFDEVTGKATFNPDFVNQVEAAANAFATLAGWVEKAILAMEKWGSGDWRASPMDAGSALADMARDARGRIHITQGSGGDPNLAGTGLTNEGRLGISSPFAPPSTPGRSPMMGRNFIGPRPFDVSQGLLGAMDRSPEETLRFMVGEEQKIKDIQTEQIRLKANGALIDDMRAKDEAKRAAELLKQNRELARRGEEEAKQLLQDIQKTDVAESAAKIADLELQKSVAITEQEKIRLTLKIELAHVAEDERKALAAIDPKANPADKAAQIIAIRNAFNAKAMQAEYEFFSDSIKLNKDTEDQKAKDSLDRFKETQKEIQKAAEESSQKIIDETNAKYDDMAKGFGDAFAKGIDDVIHSGKVKSLWTSLIEMLTGSLSQGLSGLITNWVKRLTDRAKGEWVNYGTDPNTGGPMVINGQTGEFVKDRGARYAGYAVGGIQAAAGLYSIYKQGQMGMSKGDTAASGAITGATAGSAFGAYGAVVGALIGGIAGYAMGGAKSAYSIQITNGQIHVVGLGNAAAGDVADAEKRINEVIKSVSMSAFNLLSAFPASVLAALVQAPSMGSIFPDQTVGPAAAPWSSQTALGKFFDSIGFKNLRKKVHQQLGGLSGNELKDFIENQIPMMIYDAYEPIFKAGLTGLGVTEGRIADLFAATKVPGFDPVKFMDTVKSYVDVLVGIKGHVDRLAKPFSDQVSSAISDANKTPLQQMQDIQKSVADLSIGFGSLTDEQQVARGQQILQLADQWHQNMVSYLNDIDNVGKNIASTTKNLVNQIAFDQLRLGYDAQGQPIADTKAQIDFILGQQRDLTDSLKSAKTPQEIADITGQIQANAMSLYQLMGKTPEAAAQITAMLQGTAKVAQDQLQVLRDAADVQAKLMHDTLDAILKFLQGVTDLTGTGPNQNPGTVVDPFKPIHEPIEKVHDYFVGLGTVTESLTRAFSGLLPAVGGPGGGDGTVRTPERPGSPGATSESTPPINITLAGSLAPLVEAVTIQVGNRTETKIMNTLSRQNAKSVFG